MSSSSSSSSAPSAPSAFTVSDCAVCCESTSFPAAPAASITSCDHGGDVCAPCHAAHLKSAAKLVESPTLVFAIPCMRRECSGVYLNEALQTLLPNRADRDPVLERLATRRFEAMLHATVCQRRECGSLLTVEPEAAGDGAACQSVVCARCAMAMCLLCRKDAHDGVSCDEYEQAASQGSWTSEKLINAISRRCPQCQFRVFRFGGCPSMVCSRCSLNWCYGCVQPRSRGQHLDCARVATAFEEAGLQLLKQLKDDERAERRRTAALARAARREAAVREAAERRAAGVRDPDDDDTDDLSAFNPFEVLASLDVAPPAVTVEAVLSPTPPAALRQTRRIAASLQPAEPGMTRLQRRLLSMSSS